MTERTRQPLCGVALALIAILTACSQDPTATRPATGPGPTGIRYLAGSDDAAGFARATTPREFRFPEDHGAHPGYRTEWWYFTGNLEDQATRHYGFELTIFRVALTPAASPRSSSLASQEVWMAHLAITDTAAGRFQVAERLSRGAPGLAGVTGNGITEPVSVAIEDFRVEMQNDSARLTAGTEDFGIDLSLSGLERIVAQGNNGLDPKGPEPGNASYYFSAPRLVVNGEIRSDRADAVKVAGSAWMDREWSTSALSAETAGWDWFALQLDDGRDLMFYRLRGHDGSTSEFSGGSIVDAGGRTDRLEARDVELEARRYWTSPATGVSYPVEWTLAVPSENLELTIQPRLDAQELDISVRYWEGAVSVSGSANSRPIAGVGYLELAGY